ncbi:hypothetical protein KBX50_12385 [Micromonospora sp. C51]|uniref:hypothetical protein n=1 Tax=Micromonospora sp. C51 TaxID=2824879 RepID=UPI001B394BB3|nr:hypothetical protein [Micromonospora sp. C51]MBQ1049255.1 hypothetical protein [Micromonospora sp. C51]
MSGKSSAQPNAAAAAIAAAIVGGSSSAIRLHEPRHEILSDNIRLARTACKGCGGELNLDAPAFRKSIDLLMREHAQHKDFVLTEVNAQRALYGPAGSTPRLAGANKPPPDISFRDASGRVTALDPDAAGHSPLLSLCPGGAADTPAVLPSSGRLAGHPGSRQCRTGDADGSSPRVRAASARCGWIPRVRAELDQRTDGMQRFVVALQLWQLGNLGRKVDAGVADPVLIMPEHRPQTLELLV